MGGFQNALGYVLPFEGSRKSSAKKHAAPARSRSMNAPLPSIRASDATVLPFHRSEKTGASLPRIRMHRCPLGLESCF